MAMNIISEESNRRHCPRYDRYITFNAHRRRYYDSESQSPNLDEDMDSPPMSESENYCLVFSGQEEEGKYKVLADCNFI